MLQTYVMNQLILCKKYQIRELMSTTQRNRSLIFKDAMGIKSKIVKNNV
jgi:hypothetical protein